MNKQDLVKLISEKTGISKEAAGKAQKAVIEAISSTLEKGGELKKVNNTNLSRDDI